MYVHMGSKTMYSLLMAASGQFRVQRILIKVHTSYMFLSISIIGPIVKTSEENEITSIGTSATLNFVSWQLKISILPSFLGPNVKYLEALTKTYAFQMRLSSSFGR